MAEHSSANELTFRLPRSRRSVSRARALLHAVLGEWGAAQDVVDSAELVLSELVTNALRVPVPRGRQMGVRITRSVGEGLLRLAVSDAGGGRPELREPGADETGGRGLLLVDALAHRWGCEERAAGMGKTVFAELKAPDIVAAPAVREVAAVLVVPGQRVRVWGEWRTVLGVRSEPCPTGGTMAVLDLGDGPALRVHATESLAVRAGECAG
ncbi:ATP-binding protein [Streptomyces sp. NPDC058755]|uniref:ATP-binding protein n=1 Tax=Streptomyces sp. NPDC058755 TaxID=3346624 RepID=UPI0036AABCF2